MTQLPPGMFRPGESMLHELDGAVKALCLIMLLVFTAVARGPAGHFALLVFTVCLVYLSQLSFGEAIAPIKNIAPLLALIFLMNSLFYAPELAFARWWLFAPSAAGIVHGAGVGLKLACSVEFCCLLCATTPPLRLMLGVERLLWPFYRLGLPVERLALVISAALQFIPMLFKEAQDIRISQLARGAGYESKSFLDRGGILLPFIVPVFIGAFRHALALADAMLSRGYCGVGGRAVPRWEKLSLLDWAALTVCFAALALQLIIL